MAPSNASAQRPRRILMLHGFTQSGRLFRAKTGTIEKTVAKAFPGVELFYATAPIAVPAEELPPGPPQKQGSAWAWWRAQDPRGEFEGLEQGLQCIADLLRLQGPFDGVVGFSQGAAAAAMLTALLEPGRRDAFASVRAGDRNAIAFPAAFADVEHPPLRFAICYSGYASECPSYAAFYSPAIATPTLHFVGSQDTVVEESWTQDLAARFRPGMPSIVLHTGGHVVPPGKREVAVVVDFIRKVYAKQVGTEVEEEEEEDALDMDVPF
ncbi:dihydrofolate reductase [Colletotrichum sojae]|uniref:Dihydrofolate reductase n=1 Tax=Colletotrichum sojae TaxID=2175907 RepID=A0A8H6IW73_9PEZI|nr:dihydrofolate reductase [Colletotrichum sojae]